MWRLPGGCLLLFSSLVPPLGCCLSLPPGALLCGKIFASDSVGNYGSLDAYRLFVGHISGSHLVHTRPCNSRPCVFRRDHSHHVVDQCIYRRARVCRGRLSGIALLPGPDYSVVLCAGPVPPAD